jgi:hypothetical protein
VGAHLPIASMTMERICGETSDIAVFFVPATEGAMICLATAVLSQTGQAISPRWDWSSKSLDDPNQPSNSWPCSQASA